MKNESRTAPPFRGVLAGSVLLALAMVVPGGDAEAQDLEPRAFSPAPVGMNFVVLGYGYSNGNVFFDQALPVEDAKGVVQTATVGYLRTLGLFGLQSKAAVVVPFAWGDWDGLWLGEPASASRRGFGDMAVSLSVDFFGAPVRTLAELAAYRERTILGASVLVTIPVGQYDPDKLLNLGTNRWSGRFRLGASHRMGRWNVEMIGELWGFTRNPDAFGNSSIEQDPILALQLNGIRVFRPGLWLGLGVGFGKGGQTTVNGQEKDTHQSNQRFGGTLVYPFGRRNSVKISYLNSLSTRIGADFDRVSVAWQWRWGGGL